MLATTVPFSRGLGAPTTPKTMPRMTAATSNWHADRATGLMPRRAMNLSMYT
jgi:hypothetical protein